MRPPGRPEASQRLERSERQAHTGTRYLIVTADDFGLDPAINEAVEAAFRDGILTAASLMVGQPAAADAVARARRLPGLRVGLHVTLTLARPVLPPSRVPDLVDRDGRLPAGLASFGLRLALSRAARRQAEAEIRAQFEAFAATGLELDHVNAHQHFHQHPFVFDALLRIGREFGMRAMRIADEPSWLARAAGARAHGVRALEAAILGWLARRLRRRLRAAGLACNDVVFGIRCSGGFDEATMCGVLRHLRPGVAELYMHPATRAGAAEVAAGVGRGATAELAALLSGAARSLVAAGAFAVGGYRDIPR